MTDDPSDSPPSGVDLHDCDGKSQFLIVYPGAEESYWQPVPANGYAAVHVAPHLVSMQRPFSAGTQTVPAGGYVRLHAHAESEEVLHFIRGKGTAIVEGREYRLEPGVTVFLGPRQSHTLINDGTEDLHWMWFFLPSGLETFFKAIGRRRNPDEEAPGPFARPENVGEIEANTGFAPLEAKRAE
ncbi:cupin domain-containing protein [Paraburkholderia sediminicola]|uniref:cupin domain-containing protein n=1 Tax=Paraburkholderia sediminicola TaxID=458836 RepID=UPI0038B9AEFC